MSLSFFSLSLSLSPPPPPPNRGRVREEGTVSRAAHTAGKKTDRHFEKTLVLQRAPLARQVRKVAGGGLHHDEEDAGGVGGQAHGHRKPIGGLRSTDLHGLAGGRGRNVCAAQKDSEVFFVRCVFTHARTHAPTDTHTHTRIPFQHCFVGQTWQGHNGGEAQR